MKKVLSFLFVFALIAALFTGCGAKKPVEYPYQMRISINPDFMVYFDKDYVAQKIEPLNEDAKQVCEKTDFTKLPLETLVEKITEAAVDGGYLQEGGKVEIFVVEKETANPEQTKFLEKVQDVTKEAADTYDFVVETIQQAAATDTTTETEATTTTTTTETVTTTEATTTAATTTKKTTTSKPITTTIKKADATALYGSYTAYVPSGEDNMRQYTLAITAPSDKEQFIGCAVATVASLMLPEGEDIDAWKKAHPDEWFEYNGKTYCIGGGGGDPYVIKSVTADSVTFGWLDTDNPATMTTETVTASLKGKTLTLTAKGNNTYFSQVFGTSKLTCIKN